MNTNAQFLINDLLKYGATINEIAAATGISKSTIRRLSTNHQQDLRYYRHFKSLVNYWIDMMYQFSSQLTLQA